MLITDSLAKDLGQLLERELTRERGNSGNLEIALLLLIGWRREAGKKGKQERYADELEADDLEECSGEDEADDSDGWGSDVSLACPHPSHLKGGEDAAASSSSKLSAFAALKEQVAAFRHGNPYLRNLLFQDYQADPGSQYQELHFPEFGRVRIHAEALRYVDEVLLLRPLELARVKGDEPTNLHLLLQRLCRLSAALGDWAETAILRRRQANGLDATWFRKTALALREQLKRQGGKISATSRNRREKSGPYWLLAGDCAGEVGEELALRDVVDIVPKPLRQGFSVDREVAAGLRSVVGALNTRYRLLRSCGLLPEKWLELDSPSINQLKDLAKLRKHAVGTDAWKEGRYTVAFKLAFEAMLDARQGQPIAGFSRFERSLNEDVRQERSSRAHMLSGEFDDPDPAWLDSEEGYAMLARSHNPQARLADLLYDDGTESFDADLPDLGSDPADAVALSITLEEILADAGPRLTENPVLRVFFQAIFINGLAFDALCAEPQFQALLSQHPRYASLEREALGERLQADARGLVIEVLLETLDTPVSPLLAEYMRWAVLDGKPLRGKDGLFNRKSFKTLLAGEARWVDLAPEALAEALNDAALSLLESLFTGQ